MRTTGKCKYDLAKLVEVAVQFQEANAEVPGVRSIRGGTCQNNPKESEGK